MRLNWHQLAQTDAFTSNDRATEIDALKKEKEQLAQAVLDVTQQARNLEQQLLQAKQKILAQGN